MGAIWGGITLAQRSSLSDLPWPDGPAAVALGDETEISSRSGSEPTPMASLTKLVTAMVVLDRVPLAPTEQGPQLTVDEGVAIRTEELAANGAQIAPAVAGTTVSLRQALGLMVTTSAANYSYLVAEQVFGSEAAFVDAAESWITATGLSDTVVVDPAGLSPSNVSTPADMVKLARIVLTNDVVVELASQPFVASPSDPSSRLQNTNGLLGVDGIDGLKTGDLGPYGASIIVTAPVGEETAIVVLLGSSSTAQRDTDAVRLFAALRS